MLRQSNDVDQKAGQRLTAEEMDDIRQKNIAYQYLCHLEEAKKWIEACIKEDLPDTAALEDEFRHGIYLAKLGHFFAPEIVPKKKIFDHDMIRYHNSGLHFRHTDNINYFLKALKKIGLPSIFYPETTDIYEKKNIPRAVFCIHALSLYLYRLGIAPQIQDLYGKVQFSDEVMEAMVRELSKFGCQLPQFGKIGGILANELPVDEAALHAAVIAVNGAIQKQDEEELKFTMANPNCHLSDIITENIESYLYVLSDAQLEKKEVALNRSREDSCIPDAYDELLTRKEIQEHVNHTNMYCALERVQKAVEDKSQENLYRSLLSPVLRLKDVRFESINNYLSFLQKEIKVLSSRSLSSISDCCLSKSSIEKVIKFAHLAEEEENLVNKKLQRVNQCLDGGSALDTLAALKSMQDESSPLLDNGASLYHEEMKTIKVEANAPLSLEEVLGGIKFLTAIAHINAAIDSGNHREIWHYLSHSQAHIQSLDKAYTADYLSALVRLKAKNNSVSRDCPFLTYADLQEAVDDINSTKMEDTAKIDAVTAVNKALLKQEVSTTVTALLIPVLNVSCSERNGLHFYNLLMKLKTAKCELMRQLDAELWLEDIHEVDKLVKQHEKIADELSSFLHKVNQALGSSDINALSHILRSPSVAGMHLRKDVIPDICQHLMELFGQRKGSNDCSPWVRHLLEDGSAVYLDVCSKSFAFDRSAVDSVNEKLITMTDLQESIETVLRKAELNMKVEKVLIQFQAICRGHVVRQHLSRSKRAALRIQSWWRMVQLRRNYLMYKTALKMMEPQIIKVQRLVRKWLAKRRINNLTTHLKNKEDKVIVIQMAWRQHKARQDLQALTHCTNPPLAVIRKFIHLLDVSSLDFEQELKLQHVKSDVVKSIRRAQTLEAQIDELDVKIGLLVQNRITLQDVITVDKENLNPNIHEHGTRKSSKKGNKESEKIGTLRSQRGLKALRKESREKLLGYQHLFYLLQTQPNYFASLIFAIPPGKTTKFIENVIFTLYNYGANDRDNYLLLKLFKTALEEEIRCKVLRLSDIVTGNPLVVKMIVSFNRKGTGQASLRDMLGPLVDKILSDRQLQINTNPVEIYKTWVNQLEMQSGQPSGLPYAVNQEQALQYPEVQKRLLRAVTSLKEATLAFCNHITGSRRLIPYAMQYMAKVMLAALKKRFPHVSEKDILKVVGNLVYYRFINSAIVAPDAFDIVTVSPDTKLTNDQRRNLASIAKILQFAASKKGFGEEASHLTCLNPFIVECHEKFKNFFRECCLVDDPEVVYDVSQYSEAALIIKPTIYITLQEIVETHLLLLEHESILAPDAKDPLHGALQELGQKPSVYSLLGETAEQEPPAGGPVGSNALGRTEVCLALSNKFDLPDGVDHKKEGKDSQRKLFIKTKQLLIDVLQCVEGDVISPLTSGATLPIQEAKYKRIVNRRSQQEHEAKMNDTGLNRSNSFLGETRVSLHEVKTKLSHSLRRLENQGLSTRADNYQTLLNAIATDIVSQRLHRMARRSELQKLVVASKQLDTKESFYREQLQSYRTYLNTCLNNMAARNKNVHHAYINTKSGDKFRKSKATLKYTALRLHEKGVVLEIAELPSHQLKNVLFEITPLATTGVFQVQVKFMGVGMETVQLDIQELLQLQYEGVSVKQMMGKALINVNLLLHLLNTKFYSKKK